jgi:pimeloyl-ACP methyl ester carboxylesterase
MKKHLVVGGGGLKLNVLEYGQPDGPEILFLHGFSQAAQAWRHQFESDLALRYRLLALDIRGHGASEKPSDAAHYTASELWANDVKAVIETLGLRSVLLVGWSYSGLLVCDFLRHCGSKQLAGLVFCGAVTKVGSDQAGALLGPKLLKHLPAVFSTDAAVASDTMGQFVRDCHAEPMADRDYFEALGYNLTATPAVRLGLFSRTVDNDGILAAVQVPTLVLHGAKDEIILPAASQHIVDKVPGARLSMIDGAAHCPFAESAGVFNAEVSRFAEEVFRLCVVES